jgi:hypothetical protein
MELDALENAMRLGCRECFVQCSRGVGREIVQNDADQGDVPLAVEISGARVAELQS